MPIYVKKTEHNRNNVNNKLIGRYFKVAPKNADTWDGDTFQKIWENEEQLLSLTEEEIVQAEKEHSNRITENLVKVFRPLAQIC